MPASHSDRNVAPQEQGTVETGRSVAIPSGPDRSPLCSYAEAGARRHGAMTRALRSSPHCPHARDARARRRARPPRPPRELSLDDARLDHQHRSAHGGGDGSIVCISLSLLRLGVRQGLCHTVRPEATVELDDDAPQLDRARARATSFAPPPRTPTRGRLGQTPLHLEEPSFARKLQT